MDTNLFYYNNIAHYGPYEKYLDNPHTDIYKIALDDQDFWDYIGDIESNGNGSIFIQQVMMGQHSCVESAYIHYKLTKETGDWIDYSQFIEPLSPKRYSEPIDEIYIATPDYN